LAAQQPTKGTERWTLKQRKQPSSLAGAKSVSITDVLAWKIPAGHKDSEEQAIPPREPKLYTVSGFVRKVKLSDDDCDFHLELATSGTSKRDWVIVEVSASSKALQNKLAGMFNLSNDVHSHMYSATKAKKVRATGYAFFDLSHQCKKWPTKGCQHGGENVMSIWEIHPVLAIDWAQYRLRLFSLSNNACWCVRATAVDVGSREVAVPLYR
jgi:hypothetical protein